MWRPYPVANLEHKRQARWEMTYKLRKYLVSTNKASDQSTVGLSGQSFPRLVAGRLFNTAGDPSPFL